MDVSLSSVAKLILEVDTTSLTEYSAPDSLQSFTKKPVAYRTHLGRPSKIKYDYLNLRIEPKHGQENIVHDPSYALHKPYSLTCAIRRLRNFRKYNQQLEYEMNQLALYQSTAIDEALFFRLMSYTSLWPPLHTYKEIDYTSRHFFPRSRKYMRRLNDLLKTNIV